MAGAYRLRFVSELPVPLASFFHSIYRLCVGRCGLVSPQYERVGNGEKTRTVRSATRW